jgi:Zn-dependent peptidase ImmA (M78 family)
MNKEDISKIRLELNSVPVNIENIIRQYGIELDKNANLENGILGEIRKTENGKYKISIQKKDHYFRKRFTMAHELAHFLLHRDKMGNGVTDSEEIDEKNEIIKYRQLRAIDKNSKIQDNDEVEANRFAAEILMPEESLINYAKERGVYNNSGVMDAEALKELTLAFQVSIGAMRIRLENLRKVNKI